METINGMLREFPTPEHTIASSATEAARTHSLVAESTEILHFDPLPRMNAVEPTPENCAALSAAITEKLFEKGKVSRRKDTLRHPIKAKLLAAADEETEADPQTLSSFLQGKRKRYGGRK